MTQAMLHPSKLPKTVKRKMSGASDEEEDVKKKPKKHTHVNMPKR